MRSSVPSALANPMEPAAPARPTPTDVADPGLAGWLRDATAIELDALPFGVISMALDATVEHYNTVEGQLAGLTPSRVVGRSFFTSVAPCMNNAMVAHRFASEDDLDAVIDYVLTLRMAPKRVRLRLLKPSGARRMYLAVERRA